MSNIAPYQYRSILTKFIIPFQFNLTHHIRHLSFGDKYPGVHNPLDETNIIAEQSKLSFTALSHLSKN